MLTNSAIVRIVLVVVLLVGFAAFSWYRSRKPKAAEAATNPTSTATPVPGTHVVIVAPGPARGLVTVGETCDGKVRLTQVGGSLSLVVPLASLATMTRPPTSRDAAKQVLERLRKRANADNRRRELRFITDIKVLSRGSTEEQVDRLSTLYAWPWKPGFGDLKMIDSYEQTVLSEIAFVLGEPLESVVKQVREHKPVFGATETAPQDPPWDYASNDSKTPKVPGFSALGTVALSEAAMIGERVDQHREPENGLARVTLTPGTWHAYTVSGFVPVGDAEENEGEEGTEEMTLALVLMREGRSSIGRQELKPIAEVTPQFGRLNLTAIDAASLGDELLGDSVRYLGGTNVYGGKAVCVGVEELPERIPVFAAPERLPTAIVLPLSSHALDLSFLK